jgi:hypothetical protein
MQIKIKPCSIVGGAFSVVKVEKYKREKVLAVGLTEFEAKCMKIRLTK